MCIYKRVLTQFLIEDALRASTAAPFSAHVGGRRGVKYISCRLAAMSVEAYRA